MPGELNDLLACEDNTVAHHLDAKADLEPREVPRGFPPQQNGGDAPAKGEFLTTTAQRDVRWELVSIGRSFGDPEFPG